MPFSFSGVTCNYQVLNQCFAQHRYFKLGVIINAIFSVRNYYIICQTNMAISINRIICLIKAFHTIIFVCPAILLEAEKKQRLALSIINKLYNSKSVFKWLVKSMNGKSSDNIVMQNNQRISNCRNYKQSDLLCISLTTRKRNCWLRICCQRAKTLHYC